MRALDDEAAGVPGAARDRSAPVLVGSGTGDPNTPHEWAEDLAAELDSGVLLTREGVGHGPFHGPVSQCYFEAVNAYLLDLAVPTLDACPPP